MEVLRKQRASTKGKFTRLETYLARTVEVTREVLETRLVGLEDAWMEYNRIHNDILASNETTTDDPEKDYEDVETRYFELKAALRQGINSAVTTSAHASSMPRSDVKLPRIALPAFSGNYLEWTSFHDLFTSLIHSNATLSPSQKLHYLKNAISGEASSLLHSIDITDANYSEAWNLLTERYQNKRQLVQTHLSSLFGQKKLLAESPNELRNLLDTTVKHVRALHALNSPTDHWDQLLVFLVTERLDGESRKQWELCTPSTDFPTFGALKEFLEQRCRALEASNTVMAVAKPKQTHMNYQGGRAQNKPTTSSFYTNSQAISICIFCNGKHSIYKCEEFSRLSEAERTAAARKLSLCFNCLRSGHSSKQCMSTSTCKKCGKKHHSLLHHDGTRETHSVVPKTTFNNQTQVKPPNQIFTHISNQAQLRPVLLSTALVQIKDSYGHNQPCRALIDSGSQASFITEACMQKLGLRRSKADVLIFGIGQHGSGKTRGMVQLDMQSNVSDFTCHIQALVLEKVTGELPSRYLDIQEWEHIKNLQLADPKFNQPGKIELLLGADIYSELLTNGIISGQQDTPTAFNTKLGWILSGRIRSDASNQINVHFIHTDVQDQIKQFWELEELKPVQLLTHEEKECEKRFLATTKRTETGIFMVQLPIKEHENLLGFSKASAVKRMMQVERRLEHFTPKKEQYNNFLKEYLELGHMEPIPPNECQEIRDKTNYLPHHYVTKEDSTTTSLRVVFDASAKTTTGYSLNDHLLVGPKVQDDLWDILLRFRLRKYAFTADIQQMYRQIRVSSHDADLQRIVWRNSPSEPINEYRLTTVAYGTASAPFLATRVLKQLALEEGCDFPEAQNIALKDFYMDDLMSGADNLSTALNIQSELISMLKRGGFTLRKWSANDNALLETIPDEQRYNQAALNLDSENTVKTLGVHWHHINDYFIFKVNLLMGNIDWTKRRILSEISRIFDPLGLLAPIVIIAKIFIQRLWIAGITWDEAIPAALEGEWLTFRHSLSAIQAIQVTRCVIGDSVSSPFQLHGFCDASERAYTAVVYLRSLTSTGEYTVHLLCAKTKVAPVKQISLPRLELCGAVLLAKLLRKVQRSLSLSAESVHAWSDSTITISWICGHPRRWKTFVANRVSEVQDSVPPECWHHVNTKDNPADIASRGCSALTLSESNLWWHGPTWLVLKERFWPLSSHTVYDDQSASEERVAHLVESMPEPDLILRFSMLIRLKRVLAYCLRFAFNARSCKEQRVVGPLNTHELRNALMKCVQQVQQKEFHETFTALRAGKSFSSNIQALNPFIDEHGFLRVGGRLRNATIPYNHRFPIILPKDHHLTTLIVRDVHIKQLHSGVQSTLSTIRQTFWIVNGRNVVRRIIFKCQRCFLDKIPCEQQLMGDLPAHRLEPIRPFLRCGVDFGGPFFIRANKGRGGKIYKSYICLFVCFATKAIHLELVSDLTTEGFLGALKRFVARRGKCSDIYSDNGTNFVGANKELRDLKVLFDKEQPNERISDFVSAEGIVWHFLPAKAPHFGGLWEAGIKSTKTHLRRVLGEARLTYEEFYTVLTQVEACLNSRPLTPMSNDPNDLSVLTPGHFLIGDSLNALPEPDLTTLKCNRLSRWQFTQKLVQHFWKRWRVEYLSTLQQRPKWKSATNNFKIGDLVLLREDNVPPLQWVKGRIVETHPGKDHLVRVVTVKTRKGLFRRSIVKVCVLPN